MYWLVLFFSVGGGGMEKIQMEKVKYIKAVSSKNVFRPEKNSSPTDLILAP